MLQPFRAHLLIVVVQNLPFGAIQPVVSLPQPVPVLLLNIVLLGERSRFPSLAGLALAIAIFVAEKVLAVETGDFLADFNVAQHFDAGGVASGRDKFTVGATIVIDVGGGAEPELRAIFATTVHDGKVVFARVQQFVLLFFGQFGNATDQTFDLVVFEPFTGRGDFRAFLTLQGVTVARFYNEAGVLVEYPQVAVDL